MHVAILTGRGGSSLKGKNIRRVLGRPMMVYPMLAARASKLVSEIFISTDCPTMQSIGRQEGLHVIERPAELATDTAQHVDALVHALPLIEAKVGKIDTLTVLMCNCATYRDGLIDDCIERLLELEADSCVTGSQIDPNFHPMRVKRLEEGLLSTWFDMPAGISTNRQDLPACIGLDHSLWTLKVDRCFPPGGQMPWQFMGERVAFMPNEGCVDIHDEEDYANAERWLRDQGWQHEEYGA